MKIYYVGAQSVGKSTLARYTSEKYKLPRVYEIARSVLSERELQLDQLRTNLDIVDDFQREIFYRQILEEKKHTSFVSDRSFDFISYSSQHSRITQSIIEDPKYKDYIESLKNKDAIIFFVRPSKATIKQDGVREGLTWDGIISIDAMLKFILEMNGLRYFQINTDSMQERSRLIDAIISLKINQ